MKILHLIFTMKTGGTETMLVDIANEQCRMGHDVSVMVINRGSEPELLRQFAPSVRLIEIGRKLSSRNPFPVIRTNLEVMRLNPDVIHVHNERGVNILLPYLRKKIIQTVHTTGIELTGCQTRTMVAAISRAVADDLQVRCGVNAEVVMNGIKVSEIAQRKTSRQLKSLVCVGRMDFSVKGQDLLLRALVVFPELTLTLIGEGQDMDAAVRLVRSLGIEDRVKLLGKKNRSEIYNSLQNYDAFVMPSRQEGFGLVLAEAMAAGLPVVTSALPGPLEVIDGGRLGYVFQSGSTDSLIESIKRLKNEWTDAQTVAMSAGIDYAAANFSITTTVSRYLTLYSKIAKEF